MERTKTIFALNDKVPYADFKREKYHEFITDREYTLFSAIKNVMKNNGISITTTMAYYLCAVYFGTGHINRWDKSHYNKLISVDTIISLVDSNPDILKIIDMDR